MSCRQLFRTRVSLQIRIRVGSLAYILKESDAIFAFEDALHYAAPAIEGRERRKAGVENNPWCVAVAIILEAIQNNFPMELPPKGRPAAS